MFCLLPNGLRGVAILDQRGMIGRIYIHCYILNIQALGFVVSEKKIFSCYFLLL